MSEKISQSATEVEIDFAVRRKPLFAASLRSFTTWYCVKHPQLSASKVCHWQDIVSRQGMHICYSRTDVQQKSRKQRFLCAAMRAWMSFPVHGVARWVSESKKLHTPNWEVGQRQSVTFRSCLSQPVQWRLSHSHRQVLDNYEAAVSPGFLGMLFVTPLIHTLFFQVRASCLQEAFPPAIPKVQATTTVQEVQNVPSSKNTWILPVLLQTGQVETN